MNLHFCSPQNIIYLIDSLARHTSILIFCQGPSPYIVIFYRFFYNYINKYLYSLSPIQMFMQYSSMCKIVCIFQRKIHGYLNLKWKGEPCFQTDHSDQIVHRGLAEMSFITHNRANVKTFYSTVKSLVCGMIRASCESFLFKGDFLCRRNTPHCMCVDKGV